MKDRFIITTTGTIENCPIKRYIDTICSNIVIGTNVFSDFVASFTDFFGGRSGSYKRKLQIIYNEASEELKQKALKDLYYMMPASAKMEDVNYQHKVSKNMLEYIVTVQASEDISKVYSLNKQEINKILEENSKSEDGEPVPSNPQKRPIDDIKNKYEQNNKKDDTKDTTENN